MEATGRVQDLLEWVEQNYPHGTYGRSAAMATVEALKRMEKEEHGTKH